MSELTETCPYCGNDFVKLSSHLMHCKKKQENQKEIEQPVEVQEEPPKEELPQVAISSTTPEKTEKKSFFGFIKRTKKDEQKPPSEFLTMAQKLEEKEAIKNLSPEEKFKRFFSESQTWSIEPPKLSIVTKIKRFFFPSDITYKKCVFVSDESPAKFGYYPYDPKDKYLFLPDGKLYDIPQAGDTWFFDVKKFLPLVNSKDPSDIYDLPLHYVTAIHNDGVQYGQSMAFNDLVYSITSIKILNIIAAAVAVIAIIGAVVIVKQVSGDVADITTEIQAIKSIISGGAV
ncbi:hypothetical protein RE474_09625 [Methanolobus sediminis]|uniref:Uncharacterized protein n=1 Tax=Methanolobus sediminis TaxID=3072978 RepID=A0AA51UJP8_9EURY|nr:hypothetical protein [Methanolobus sediminis]WMW24348.1 hypothetical protein RE474_09625 [Methanolobus sediminis]